jgi:hypothetical protein
VPVSSAATDFFVLSVPSAMPVRTLAEFVDTPAPGRPAG